MQTQERKSEHSPYEDMYRRGLLVLMLILPTDLLAQVDDALYRIYQDALEQTRAIDYYVVITVTDAESNNTRELCTDAGSVAAAIRVEHGFDSGNDGNRMADSIAVVQADRAFTFHKRALEVIKRYSYSNHDLQRLEQKVNFDVLALRIRKAGKWEKGFQSDRELMMYAHALFKRGLLTSQSICWGGTLRYEPPERLSHINRRH